MKQCKTCQTYKSANDFYKNPSHADGLWGSCKTCTRRHYAAKGNLPKSQIASKVCNRCGQNKSTSEFYSNSRSKDGFRPRCKECHNDDNARFGRASRYGLTTSEFETMLKQQEHCCAICRKRLEHFKDSGRRENAMNIDHCHLTGKVRGILCSGCNRGLGAFRDSPDSLRAAADYLTRSTAVSCIPSAHCHESANE